jgi:aryl-alcohol dehydrogenase (NADP+)
MNPLCVAEGIGLIPWSPLARGWLAGTRRPDKSGETTRAQTDEFARDMYEPEDLEVVEAVHGVATRLGRPMAQVAIAWILSRPAVTAPIIGATRMEHLEGAVKALDITLEPADVKAMEDAYRPHRVLGHR